MIKQVRGKLMGGGGYVGVYCNCCYSVKGYDILHCRGCVPLIPIARKTANPVSC